MPSRPVFDGSIPPAVQDRIDELCLQFEQAWRTQDPLPVERLLPCVEEAYRPALLWELLTIEIAQRRANGEAPTADEYHGRFPEASDYMDELLASTARVAPGSTVSTTATSKSHNDPLPVLPGYSFSGRQLGEGGMGVVWRARDERLHRDVAVKVLRSAFVDQPAIVRRFEEEAQLTSQLQHPGIPPVHQTGTLTDGRPYFCMKVVKGQTLEDLLRERVSPTEDLPRFLQIFGQVCQAIGYAHNKGVVHRDLKPSNVMVGAFGEVQVMDWGLGKVLSAEEDSQRSESAPQSTMASVVETDRAGAAGNATQAGSVLGTYAYMPPEQALGVVDRVDRRSDVFGLGSILCEILTGGPPFQGTATEVKARAQLGDLGPVRDRLHICGADPALVALAEACLRREQNERPADGGVVAAEIESYQADVRERLQRVEIERATAEAESRRAAAEAREEQVRVTAKSERRARRLAWGLAAALALGLVGTSWFFVLARRQADHAEAAQAVAEEQRQQAVTIGEDLKRLTYAHQIGLAQAEWEANNARNAWDHLESTDPIVRGWEYRYLRQLFDRNQMTIADHGIQIRSVAFRTDGKYFAAPGGNNTVKVRDALTSALVKSLPHSVEVEYAAFSPDGRFLASGGEGLETVNLTGDDLRRGEVKVWDAETFDEVHTFDVPTDGVWCVAFDPESRFLAAATGRWGGSSPGEIKIWSTSNWQETRTLRGHEKWVAGVAFSPNGWLASGGGDGTVRIWDVVTGEQIGPPLKPHTLTDKSVIFNDAAIRIVRNVAFSPDGKLVAAAYWDGTVGVWDAAAGQLVRTLEGHRHCVHNVAFSPDGKRLASASWDGTIKLWYVDTYKEERTLKGHRDWVLGLSFSPDGRRLATGCMDAMIKLWDLAKVHEMPVLTGHTEEVLSVSFAPDGVLLASGSADGTVKVWNTVSGEVLQTLKEYPHAVDCVALSADKLATGVGQTASIWDLPSGQRQRSLAGHADSVTCLVFSPDGRYLATGSRDRRVIIWDAQSGNVMHVLTEHTNQVNDLAFSPDNRYLASCGSDKNVIISDVVTGQTDLVLRGHKEAVTSVMFSSNGHRLVSTDRHDSATIWEARTGRAIRSIGLKNAEAQIARIDPDGRRLFTVDSHCSIRIWDVDSEPIQNVLILRGHRGQPHCLSLSPDGTRLASAGWDKTIRIWEAPLLVATPGAPTSAPDDRPNEP